MPTRFGLLLKEWPAEDQRLWSAATSADDFFGSEALASHWSQKTRYQAQTAYGRWLAFLAAHVPSDLKQPTALRLTADRTHSYVESLRQRGQSEMGVAAELNHLIMALTAIAPKLDQDLLKRIQKAAARNARPRERRNKIIDARRLYALGISLMENALEEPRVTLARRDFRDGLIIALLVSRPLRLRNLAEIQIGLHLIASRSGYDLAFPVGHTKTGVPLDFDIPTDLVRYVKLYLDRYREMFAGAATHRGMWLSAKSGQLTDSAIYRQICKRTRAAFGTAINPHLFRNIAATTLAQLSPERSGVASDLLGHSKSATTDRFYICARSLEASRQYGELVAPLPKARRRS